MNQVTQDAQHYTIGNVKLQIFPTRADAGAAAAKAAAETLKELDKTQSDIGVIFATGASQAEMFKTLVELDGIPWSKINGFHLDEYINLSTDHIASTRNYIRAKLTRCVQLKKFLEIDGNSADPEEVCQSYGEAVRVAKPQLCMLGIGENGHLAFNDPAEDIFDQTSDVKIVLLATETRNQLAAEGRFKSLEEVCTKAITLTIPALMRVPKLIVTVPGKRKASALRRTFEESLSINCPSTILRTHRGVTIFVDNDAASELTNLPALAVSN